MRIATFDTELIFGSTFITGYIAIFERNFLALSSVFKLFPYENYRFVFSYYNFLKYIKNLLLKYFLSVYRHPVYIKTLNYIIF